MRLLIPTILAATAVFVGCLGPSDTGNSSAPGVPIGRVELAYPTGASGFFTIRPPVNRVDGFGVPTWVFPVETPGFGGDPRSYVAYWDPNASRFISFGDTFGYNPIHDVVTPYFALPMLFFLGIRRVDDFQMGQATAFTASGPWTVAQSHVNSTESVKWTGGANFDNLSVEFLYASGSSFPARIVVHRYDDPLSFPEFTLSAGKPEAVVTRVPTGFYGADLPKRSAAASSHSTLGAKPWRSYPLAGGGQLWGPPGTDDRLAPFTLDEALRTTAARKEASDFATSRGEPFLLSAARRWVEGQQGLDQKLTWTLELGTGCRRGPGHAPDTTLRMVVSKTLNPVQLPPSVDSAREANCPVVERDGEFASRTATVSAWIPIDDLLGKPPVPGSAPINVDPRRPLGVTATLSCYRSSNWSAQISLVSGDGSLLQRFSFRNGQLLQASVESNPNPLVGTIECLPSLPGSKSAD